MFLFFLSISKALFLLLFQSKRDIAVKYISLKKEYEIIKRNLSMKNKKVRFTFLDRVFFSFCHHLAEKIRDYITLFKPETLLKWYRKFMKKKWDFSHKNKNRKPGRPPVPMYVKNLILKIKKENRLMGARKIRGELLKLGYDIKKQTIIRILNTFRQNGKLPPDSSIGWNTFIKSQIKSIYTMDFLTVGSIFGKRFYVFFIMYLKTREIVQFRVTDIPSQRFVRNQLIGFMDDKRGKKIYLIHDGTGEFYQNYSGLGIRNKKISPGAANMNAYAERFVGSVRRESLDWFIIIGYSQLCSILREYIYGYYNRFRPHQGINQNIPVGYSPQKSGKIVSIPFLSGIWHHYYRRAA